MNEFVAVVGIAALAAGLTYLGVPAAERYNVPHRIVSAALQFAAGIITALVVSHLDAAGDAERAIRIDRACVLRRRPALRAAGALHQASAG